MPTHRFRYRLARWISPELAREADRGLWTAAEIEHLRRWLAEFPIVEVVLDRIIIGVRNHFRPLSEPSEYQEYRCDDTRWTKEQHGLWPGDIAGFRQQLRRAFSRKADR